MYGNDLAFLHDTGACTLYSQTFAATRTVNHTGHCSKYLRNQKSAVDCFDGSVVQVLTAALCPARPDTHAWLAFFLDSILQQGFDHRPYILAY